MTYRQHLESYGTKRNKKALIYCRVSGKKQVADGSGLSSQEYRCRQYAEAKGYTVEAVFPDDVSGGGDFMKRPGMVALLQYMDDNPSESYVVVFDDLKRYARDVEFHLRLRRVMIERGATRECLNFNFEDTPEGKFNEIITAAAGELERLQMGRQNRQKSMARIEQGYAAFSRPPVGYKYVKSKQGGKILIKDEPLATIVKAALEGFASGRFGSQVEVVRFLEAQPEFPKSNAHGKIHQQRVVMMLRQIMYAGYLSAPGWGISLREAKHEPLITRATFEKIQSKLDEGVYAPTRKDISADFVARGAVSCATCGSRLTAGWSSGKYKKYPYYLCKKKSCTEYGKSIARDKIDNAVSEALKALTPSKGLFQVVSAMIRDCWELRHGETNHRIKTMQSETKSLDKQIDELVERMLDVSNPRALKAFEDRIDRLEREKYVLQEKIGNSGKPIKSQGELFELSMVFLSNPWKLWETGQLELRRMVLKLAFPTPMTYCRATGSLNTKTAFPFKVLGNFSAVCGNGAAEKI